MAHVVYRIENNDGHGPYHGEARGVAWDRFCPATQYSENHPAPKGDGLPGKCFKGDGSRSPKEHFKCAFSDLQSLMDWFYDAAIITDLERCGFSLVRLEFDGEAYHGGHQSLYTVERLLYREVIPFRSAYGSKYPLTLG